MAENRVLVEFLIRNVAWNNDGNGDMKVGFIGLGNVGGKLDGFRVSFLSP